MAKLGTVDVNADGSVTTIAIMIDGSDSAPETIGEIIRHITNAGVSIDFAQGNDVLGPYSSGTASRRATVDEWLASIV